MLVYDEIARRHFQRIAIVTRVLPSRESEVRGKIVGMAKTNIILKPPVKKLFIVKNTYHDTNQTDKAKGQKLRREAAVTGELKMNCEW